VEVLAKIPAHARLLRRMRERFARGDVALVVLVDYPGFHLHVAKAARDAGIPVLYYIAPQLWAWAERRVRKLRERVTRLAVILPFEEPFFRSHGVEATFVGHPLLDRPPAAPDRVAAAAALGLDPARPVLSVFPGSRTQEVRRLWPTFRDAAARVQAARPEVQVVVAATGADGYPGADRWCVARDRAALCLIASDAALCKSGTTTLETAIAGVPMVVAYRVHPLSYVLARMLTKLRWIGLVNLVAGREVAPEFIQERATPEALAGALLPLLDAGSAERARQIDGLLLVRRRLGEPGASDRAASIAASLLAP
jgi:lipid-A-disaccharide synthase